MTARMGHTEPTNAKGRALFAALSPEVQDRVRVRANELYDGTRTVAQCWKEALCHYAPGPEGSAATGLARARTTVTTEGAETMRNDGSQTPRITDDEIRAFRKQAVRQGSKPLVGACDCALGLSEPGPGGKTPEEARAWLARYIAIGRES